MFTKYKINNKQTAYWHMVNKGWITTVAKSASFQCLVDIHTHQVPSNLLYTNSRFCPLGYAYGAGRGRGTGGIVGAGSARLEQAWALVRSWYGFVSFTLSCMFCSWFAWRSPDAHCCIFFAWWIACVCYFLFWINFKSLKETPLKRVINSQKLPASEKK